MSRTDPISASRTLHVLGPRSDAQSVAERLLEQRGAVVLDLSAPTMGGNALADVLSERIASAGDRAEWISGGGFALRHAAEARRDHIAWLTDASSRPLVEDRSLKELFVYRSHGHAFSAWWLTGPSKKNAGASPYPWLFYAFRVVEDMLGGSSFDACCLHVSDAPTALALEQFVARACGFGGEVTTADFAPRSPTGWPQKAKRVLSAAAHVWRSVGAKPSGAALPWREGRARRVLVHTTDEGSWVEQRGRPGRRARGRPLCQPLLRRRARPARAARRGRGVAPCLLVVRHASVASHPRRAAPRARAAVDESVAFPGVERGAST